jgi:hypothetical protein
LKVCSALAMYIITSGRKPPTELDFSRLWAKAVRAFSACSAIGEFGCSSMKRR